MRGGYRTRTEAQDGLDDMRDEIRRGVVTHDEGYTVASWLRKWLKDGERTGWAVTTLDGYTADVDTYLIPMLGHIRLRDLRRAHVTAMLAKLAEVDETRTSRKGQRGGSAVPQRSQATIDRIRRSLRSALTAAVQEDLIPINPAAGRLKPVGRRESEPACWWQPQELQRFLDHVTDDPDVALWTVVALTGLRRSEVLGLRWTDLDLDGTQPGLWVRQRCSDVRRPVPCPDCGKVHRGRALRTGAKSKAGYRWVPLVGLVVVELTAHKAKQKTTRDEFGYHWSEHGLVFPIDHQTRRSRDLPGSPRRPDDLTDRHRQLVAAAQLPTIVLHEMRHGAVSLLAAAGMPIEQIALIVGHSTEEVTKAVYLHGIRGVLADHAQSAADLVRPPTTPPAGG